MSKLFDRSSVDRTVVFCLVATTGTAFVTWWGSQVALQTSGTIATLSWLVLTLSLFIRSRANRAIINFYHKAWGKPWPQFGNTVSKAEIDDEGHSSAHDDADDLLHGLLRVPLEFRYQFFKGIEEIKWALGASRGLSDVLVIRREYKTVFEALKWKAQTATVAGVVVTGQPGIGKTTFLLYVLLRRLESKLPTAVQLDNEKYFIFDEQGATVCPIDAEDLRLNECWALADSNQHAIQPCSAFLINAKFVIQTTSPKPERWKGWVKQNRGTWIVMDPPSVPEIAAILKEHCIKTSSFLPFVRKYGPSIPDAIAFALGRTTIEIMGDQVEQSLREIFQPPLRIFDSVGNALLPQSRILSVRRPVGPVIFREAESFIPTPYLLEIFEGCRCQLPNQTALDLFSILSRHSFTRTVPGWEYEQRVHQRLGTDRAALEISQDHIESTMEPSTRMLPGILDGLKQTDVSDSFYWMPTGSNFQGVDSVLGTSDGGVYIIQAIIAGDHKDPMEGIRKVWDHFNRDVRAQRSWHYVIVADTKWAAMKYVNEFSTRKRGFTLGQEGVPVQVWGCVL